MKVKYAPHAFRDIDAILAQIQTRSSSGARTVSLAIERAAESCALVPYAGAKTDRHDVYRAPISRHRLTVFYRVDADEDAIEIVRVVRAGRVRNLRRVPDDEF